MADQSNLPETSFLARLAAVNRLGEQFSGPACWFFHPGMLFMSRAKWWGDFKFRHACHEGIDLALIGTGDGTLVWLPRFSRVPCLREGRVINVCADFLGQSVIVEHGKDPATRTRIVSIYSHLEPGDAPMISQPVSRLDIIGITADTSMRKSGIPSHLHVSIAQIDMDIPASGIDWSLIGSPDPKRVKLYNPLRLLTLESAGVKRVIEKKNKLNYDPETLMETGLFLNPTERHHEKS